MNYLLLRKFCWVWEVVISMRHSLEKSPKSTFNKPTIVEINRYHTMRRINIVLLMILVIIPTFKEHYLVVKHCLEPELDILILFKTDNQLHFWVAEWPSYSLASQLTQEYFSCVCTTFYSISASQVSISTLVTTLVLQGKLGKAHLFWSNKFLFY